jgi:hypothetical protein
LVPTPRSAAHSLLDRQSAAEGGDARRRLKKHAIANGVDHSPSVGRDDQQNRGLKLAKSTQCTFLVASL